MHTKQKELVIVKIGGSVLTYKSRAGVHVRRTRLTAIAREIAAALRTNAAPRLILIHGSGAVGHQLATHYKLQKGTGSDPKKRRGALKIQRATQLLDHTVADACDAAGVRTMSVHTASVVMQQEGRIHTFETAAVEHALTHDTIPLVYGEMVPDTTRGMTICSGDTLAVHLAKVFGATRILYASDIDGIFDKDPHLHSDARHIKTVSLNTIQTQQEINVSGSHHTDVTGGLHNKLHKVFEGGIPPSLREVVIFNGLTKGVFKQALLGKQVGTQITV